MMEQLKKVRANRKYVLTIAYKATKRAAQELNRAFKLFEKASNEYLAVLEREEDVQCAKEYYDIEEKKYIKNLKMKTRQWMNFPATLTSMTEVLIVYRLCHYC